MSSVSLKAEVVLNSTNDVALLMQEYFRAYKKEDASALSELLYFETANQKARFLSSIPFFGAIWMPPPKNERVTILDFLPDECTKGQYGIFIPISEDRDEYRLEFFEVVQDDGKLKLRYSFSFEEMKTKAELRSIFIIKRMLSEWESVRDDPTALANKVREHKRYVNDTIRAIEYAKRHGIALRYMTEEYAAEVKQAKKKLKNKTDAEVCAHVVREFKAYLDETTQPGRWPSLDLEGEYAAMHIDLATTPQRFNDPNGEWVITYHVQPEGSFVYTFPAQEAGSKTIATEIERLGGELLVSFKGTEVTTPWAYIHSPWEYSIRLPQDATLEFDKGKQVSAVLTCKKPEALRNCGAVCLYYRENSQIPLYCINIDNRQFNEESRQWTTSLRLMPGVYFARTIQEDGSQGRLIGVFLIRDEPDRTYEIALYQEEGN